MLKVVEERKEEMEMAGGIVGEPTPSLRATPPKRGSTFGCSKQCVRSEQTKFTASLKSPLGRGGRSVAEVGVGKQRMLLANLSYHAYTVAASEMPTGQR